MCIDGLQLLLCYCMVVNSKPPINYAPSTLANLLRILASYEPDNNFSLLQLRLTYCVADPQVLQLPQYLQLHRLQYNIM